MKENDTDANDPGKSPDPKAWWVQSQKDIDGQLKGLRTTFSPVYPLDSHQSVRLQLVIELIRAGRIDDCLSLAHEAEQFVLNGMENKPVNDPILDGIKPVEGRLVLNDDCSISFVEKSADPSQGEVQGVGESAEPQMTLWEMCEKIRESQGMPSTVSGVVIERVNGADYLLTTFTTGDSGAGYVRTIISEKFISPTKNENAARETLMRFPPFKK